MTAQMTHQGRIVGTDSRTSDGYSRLVQLHATKTLWIDSAGGKWSKAGGYPSPRQKWAKYRLDLNTVEVLP